MIKLTQEHISAICHAELFLESATEAMDSRKMIQRIQNDRLRLTEVKLYIIESMTTPELPYAETPVVSKESDISKSRE